MRPPARVAAAPCGPYEIPGALWQAGVTPNNHRFKVLFNGEPRPDIIAAGVDWIMVLPPLELGSTKISPGAPLGHAYLTDPFAEPKRIEGQVQIVHAGGTLLSEMTAAMKLPASTKRLP